MRVKKYRVFDIGNDTDYFGDDSDSSLNNKWIMERVGRKSYLPANALLLELLEKHPEFRCSFSFSGIFLEQIESDFPEILASFQKLIATGRVEVLSETYYHSLAYLYSREEFYAQVAAHKDKVQELFNVVPKVFRNTELIYNNALAQTVEEMGFDGIIAEGADHVLGDRNPGFLYQPEGTQKIKALLRNYKLTDDIGFRFSEESWAEYPLSADRFAKWVSDVNGNGNLINLFMDYETFGEHQWEESGIFDFMRALPGEILKNSDNDFVTPSEALARYDTLETLDAPDFYSWADVERDLSAWRSNAIQEDALIKIYALEEAVKATQSTELITVWRRLQTSDHFYYMCTKFFADGDVHKYFNPYDSPYDAFISYMNALSDLERRLIAHKPGQRKSVHIPPVPTVEEIVAKHDRRRAGRSNYPRAKSMDIKRIR